MAGHHISVCYYGDLVIKTHTHPYDFDGMLLLSIPHVTLLQLFSFRNLTFRIRVSYNKHMCVCECVRNGRSPEMIRPPGKRYFFLWGMATVGQREGVQ